MTAREPLSLPEQAMPIARTVAGPDAPRPDVPARGVHVIPGEIPEGTVPPSTSMATPRLRPGEMCGASTGGIRLGGAPPHHIGPCVLRHGHDGPIHQAADGVQWAGTVGSAPRPYVHLTYGSWEASGHQCGDLRPGGCDGPVYERAVTARWNGLGQEQVIGWELGECPSCTPRPDVPDEAVKAVAEQLLSDYDAEFDAGHLSRKDFTGQARKLIEVASPHIREQVAAELEALRDGVENKDTPYNEAFVHALDCAVRAVRREAK